jgi:hypothetical protein
VHAGLAIALFQRFELQPDVCPLTIQTGDRTFELQFSPKSDLFGLGVTGPGRARR